MSAEKCIACGSQLTIDDIGIYRKMINRGADRIMCIQCLARELKVDEKYLYERIEYFKSMGCTLFMYK